MRLKSGVSLSQTRFALADFCLSHLGADGQYFADVIELCGDTHQLQEALNAIRAEVRTRCPERLAALAECVREANETDSESAPAAAARVPSPASAASATARGTSAGAGPGTAAPAAAPPQRKSEHGPLRLKPGVSLAQARFTLTQFCLDQFGAKGQQLVDAISRCAEVGGMQKILTLIGADIQANHPGSAERLAACVREINDTAE
jgi:hypothetical protein